MSEIPEDVMQIARAVRDKTCVDTECTFDAGCGCLEAIARAIMAERERCTGIARHFEGMSIEFSQADGDPDLIALNKIGASMARAIAERIQRGN